MVKADQVELAQHIEEIIRNNMNSDITPRFIQTELEAKYGRDLSDSKADIKKLSIEVYQNIHGQQEKEKAQAAKKPKEKKPRPEGAAETGLQKELRLAPELSAFMGGAEKMARTAVVKEIWKYVKEKSLQDPEDGRKIIPDAKLNTIFGTADEDITAFTMNKLITPLFLNEDGTRKQPNYEAAAKRKAAKAARQEREKLYGKRGKNGKLLKKKRVMPIKYDADGNIIKRPNNMPKMKLSAQMQRITGAPVMTRPEVVKAMWQYIKDNELQDKEQKKIIHCDANMKAIIGLDSVTGFQMNKYISPHMLEKVPKPEAQKAP